METSERPDIFDRLMALPGLRVLGPFYRKHKAVLLYLFFGALTTVISIAVFWLFRRPFGLNELVANVLSWLAAVLFAFLTNRVWVFRAPTKTAGEFLRQMGSFYGGRVVTLLIEEVLLGVFITWLRFPDMPVKIAAQFVVVVLNYFISKLFVFRKPKEAHTMEWNEAAFAALDAAMEDGVLTESIAEAKDAGEICSLLKEKGVELSEETARSAFTALERLRDTGVTQDDLEFIKDGCRALGEDGIGAFISILSMVKYRRCLF